MTNLSVCLFVCQQVACDVVTVYSRSESPCHVSLSQIGIDRLLDRSIDQSRFPGQSLDQSICVCRCLYKEQHPLKRALTSAVRSSARSTSSLFSSHPHDLSRAYTTCPRRRDIAHILQSRWNFAPCTFSIAAAHAKSRTRRRIHDAGCTCERSRARNCAEEQDEESQESGTESGGYQRPSWVPRTKLTHHVNCLSTTLPVYIYRYINILYIYVYIHICVRVYDMCVYTRVCRERDENSRGWLAHRLKGVKRMRNEPRHELCKEISYT